MAEISASMLIQLAPAEGFQKGSMDTVHVVGVARKSQEGVREQSEAAQVQKGGC